tara:strand:- start:4027 stop:4833 length:807 start_codon:yes stop_codon:yes gene_type:complete
MDYYNILGVTRNASDSDIKAAYRKLAMQHHPDRGGDSTQFAKINQAYEVLKDPARRAQYDNPQPQGFGPNGFQGMGGFEDLFSQFGFNRRPPMQNKNVQIAHTIELLDVFRGKSVITKYNLHSGRTETLEINIPPGVKNNDIVNFRGYGDDSIPNIPRGDLILKIRVKKHPKWERDENNLMCICSVGVFDCILGCKIDLTTLDGSKLSINIPPATNSGTVLSVGGYGLPDVNTGKRGNIYVKIKTTTPRIKSKNIVKQLRAIRDELNK